MVIRYDAGYKAESPDGEYVRHEDYQAVETELKRFKSICPIDWNSRFAKDLVKCYRPLCDKTGGGV